MSHFNRLEADILEWIVLHHGPEPLRSLLASAWVEKREYTGCGFHIDLGLPDTALPLQVEEIPRGPLGGPTIQSPSLEHGGGSLLFLDNGLPSLLELHSYGEVFPEEMEEYTLVDPPDGTASS